MSISQALFDDFHQFFGAYDGLGDPEPLSEYLLTWLEQGDAVIEAGGDFGTYMQGVVYIIARWLEDPSVLDFKGSSSKAPYRRSAAKLVGNLTDLSDSLVFDPTYFRMVLFRRIIKGEGIA